MLYEVFWALFYFALFAIVVLFFGGGAYVLYQVIKNWGKNKSIKSDKDGR